MLMGDIVSKRSGDLIVASASVESKHYGSTDLWFSVPAKYEHYVCGDLMDGFVVGMLYPAMMYGEDIHVSGPVSERLLFNLNNYAIPLLCDFSSSLKKIKITHQHHQVPAITGCHKNCG